MESSTRVGSSGCLPIHASNAGIRRNCDMCVQKKVKCMRPKGASSCDMCQRKGLCCAYSVKKRPGPKSSRKRDVNQLELPLYPGGTDEEKEECPEPKKQKVVHTKSTRLAAKQQSLKPQPAAAGSASSSAASSAPARVPSVKSEAHVVEDTRPTTARARVVLGGDSKNSGLTIKAPKIKHKALPKLFASVKMEGSSSSKGNTNKGTNKGKKSVKKAVAAGDLYHMDAEDELLTFDEHAHGHGSVQQQQQYHYHHHRMPFLGGNASSASGMVMHGRGFPSSQPMFVMELFEQASLVLDVSDASAGSSSPGSDTSGLSSASSSCSLSTEMSDNGGWPNESFGQTQQQQQQYYHPQPQQHQYQYQYQQHQYVHAQQPYVPHHSYALPPQQQQLEEQQHYMQQQQQQYHHHQQLQSTFGAGLAAAAAAAGVEEVRENFQQPFVQASCRNDRMPSLPLAGALGLPFGEPDFDFFASIDANDNDLKGLDLLC